ncbi:MAG: maleate cis-trans isomerase family protein [Actinomycetes bacterium]
MAPFDFALDRELWRWTPHDMSLHITRTPWVAEPVSIELAEKVSEPVHVRRAIRNLQAVEPEVLAYACTSGSFVYGLAGEQKLTTAMRRAGAPTAITTSGALLQAVKALRVHRLVVITPYVESVTVRLRDFLSEGGVETVSSEQLGLHGNIWKVPYETTAQLIRDADVPQAQAVFVSCTNLPTFDIIEPLERELRKPVLTANQVTMWAALRRIGAAQVKARQKLLRAR